MGTLPALPLEFGVPRTVDIRGRLFSGGWCPGRCGLSGIPVPTHSMPGAPPGMTTTGVPRRCPASPAGVGGTYCSVLKLLFEIPCLSGHKSCCPPTEGKPPFGQDPVISLTSRGRAGARAAHGDCGLLRWHVSHMVVTCQPRSQGTQGRFQDTPETEVITLSGREGTPRPSFLSDTNTFKSCALHGGGGVWFFGQGTRGRST